MTTTPEQPGDANIDDGGPLTSSHQSRLDHGPDVDPATAPPPRRESPPSTQTPVLPDLPVLSDPKTISNPTNAGSNEITDSEPDVLGPEDIHGMRVRLQELGLIAKDPSSSTSGRSHSATESELAAMVLRLISHHEYTADSDLSNQVSTQAHTIASLTSQRNFLMTQYALSCASWQAEREGWDRSAEALIAQRAAAAAITKEEIIDRNVYRLEDDNKRLREKLSETQQRVSVLESQLFNLRPLLLIPPVSPDSSGSSSRHKRPSTSGALRSNQETSTTQVSKAPTQHTPEPTVDMVSRDDAGVPRKPSPTTAHASAVKGDLGPIKETATIPLGRVNEDRSPTPSRLAVTRSSDLAQPSSSSSFPQGRFTGANIYSSLPQQPQTPQTPPTADYSNRPRPTYYRTAKDYEISLARPRQTRASKAQPAHPLTSALTWLADQQSASTSTSGSSLGLGLGGNVGIGPAKKSSALMSDARAELVLAAARKMGKARASRVAGMLGIDVSKTVREIRDERRAEVREEVHLVSEGWGKALEREQAGEKTKDGSTGKVDKGKGKATDYTDTAAEKKQDMSISPKKTPRRKPVKKAATMPTLQVGAQPPLPVPQGPGGSSSYYASFHSMSHLVVLNPAQSGRMSSGGGVPVLVPVGSVWPPPGPRPPHIAAAPSSSPSNPPSNSPGAQPGPSTLPVPPSAPSLPQSDAIRTPPKRTDGQPQSQGLDSLLNAARLLDEEYDSPHEEPPAAPKPPRRSVRRTRRSAAAELDEDQGSPSKRRKIAGSPAQSSLSSMTPEPPPKTGKSRMGRVSSALDVLADQAAQEQERRPSLGVESEQRPGIGFGKPTSSERPVTPSIADEAVEEELPRQRARVSEVRRSHSASRHTSPVPARSTWQAPPHAPSPLAVHTREHTPHLSDQDAPGSPDDSAAERST